MEKHPMENTRRGFLGGLGAAFATLTLPTPTAAAQAATDAAGNPIPKKTISNPYIYRFSIGGSRRGRSATATARSNKA